MKLSDYKGEEALDVLADIIEPLTYVIADKEIQELARQKPQPPAIKFVKPAIKNHKKELIQILARLENQDVEEYAENMSLITLPMQILDLINDPEVQSLFRSQGKSQVTSLASSSSAMENIEAGEN